jgi:hypothetical protein
MPFWRSSVYNVVVITKYRLHATASCEIRSIGSTATANRMASATKWTYGLAISFMLMPASETGTRLI